ncbi:obscurin-like protein 1 [Rhincodon typus]|uniref:obscurin-like protein 1 n=1 Tax=Rhincodon typus TaxID=259920 RepID=UPI00202E82B5|nr:obscurin-like protein 1 [Rhincodon typus]
MNIEKLLNAESGRMWYSLRHGVNEITSTNTFMGNLWVSKDSYAEKEPPVKIIRQIEGPTEHKYLTSEDVTLQCELTRLDGVAKWYKDGEKVVDNERISIGSEGTFRSLRVLDAQITDSGEYLCDIQSDSIVFRVCVEVPPIEIIRQTGGPADRKYLTSEDVMLQCELSRPDGVAKWYKDGEKVLENERISIRREGTLRSLRVLDARTTDSGEYLCDVQNDSLVFRVRVEGNTNRAQCPQLSELKPDHS